MILPQLFQESFELTLNKFSLKKIYHRNFIHFDISFKLFIVSFFVCNNSFESKKKANDENLSYNNLIYCIFKSYLLIYLIVLIDFII